VLTLGKIGGGGGDGRSAGYYTASVAKGRDDYYSGAGEAPGQWFGAGAAAIGLVGEVDPADFQQVVMAAVNPRSAEPLRKLVRDKPVCGMDLTFSAPKSASLLFHIGGGDERAAVGQAHDEAVVAALGYMEREACVVRAGDGGKGGKAVAEGFVGAVFRHRTSRALDPQLHTHAVVANLARRSDGRYIALDGTALYRHAKTGGFLYQAELRARLTEYLGVEWGPVKNGAADIRGVPTAVIDHFSKRRAQIVEALEGRASRSARSAQDAALRTRPAKERAVDLAQLVREWAAVAAELGLGRSELDALTDRVTERHQPERAELAELAERLSGPGGLTRRASSFDRRTTIQAFCESHSHGATARRMEHLADRFLDSRHVLSLEGQPMLVGPDTIRRRDGRLVVRSDGPRYTTPDMLRREAGLVSGAAARMGEGAGTADAGDVAQALAARRGLGVEQEAMVRSLTQSGDGVQVVRAAAGTGKTYALDGAREVWEASGYRVVGATLSARAACELRDIGGIDSTTVAQLLSDLERGYGFIDRNVVVVDEAGMVGTRQLETIAAACAAAGAKLVLVGDDRQLPEIDAGGGFRGLAERLGACELREVRRQRDAADRAALQDLRDGRPADWLRSADERGQLVVERGSDAQYEHLVSDWWHGREGLEHGDAMILAPTREAAAALNERARAYMRQAGRLGDRELAVGDDRFAVGDRVMCLHNARDLGVLNGLRGTVVDVEEPSRSLRVALDGHEQEVVLPASYLEDAHVAHGYAMTVHKSQGMTAARTYVLGSAELYQELGYTALSRHQESCRFYLNAGEVSDQLELDLSGEQRDRTLARVERALGQSRAQEMALDVHERDQELASLSDTQLAERAGRLDELLASYPAPARDAERHAAELNRHAEEIRGHETRLGASRNEREALGPLRRSARATLNERITRQEQVLAGARASYGRLADEPGAARQAGDQWLEQHGLELAEATIVEHELDRRRRTLLEDAVIRAAYEADGDLARELGPRPASLVEREQWQAAAIALADYQLRYGELPDAERPLDGPRRRAWDHSRRAVDELRAPSDPAPPLAAPDIAIEGPDVGP